MNEPDEMTLALACQLVGEFLWHFSRLEEKVDAGISKLFGLNPENADILTANIDFNRKLNVFWTCAALQSEGEKEVWVPDIKKTFEAIRGVNNPYRLTIAHSTFEPYEVDGVRFRRVVADGKLNRQNPIWTKADFIVRFERIDALASDLELIVKWILPYVPSLDFSDPRNSMYMSIFF